MVKLHEQLDWLNLFQLPQPLNKQQKTNNTTTTVAAKTQPPNITSKQLTAKI
jgi:hypothetical protein